jgi:tripartite-type tricarboxylate transporter receptor subunit TctC
MLALGAALKARFNLVPYGGGNPTMVSVMSGEADCGALPIAGVVSQREQMRVLGVFNDEYKLAKYTDNAPPVNKVFGTKIPELSSSRSWAVHTEAIEKYPDRFALLEKTSKQVSEDPRYKEAFAKTGAPPEAIQYGDRETCNRYVKGMIELTNEYRSLLTAKSKK